MGEKRNPTERTEERSGEEAAPGPAKVPEDAEQAEYAGYRKDPDREPGPRQAEAEREADLQPGREGSEPPDRDEETPER